MPPPGTATEDEFLGLSRERWDEFMVKLEGPEGCDFREGPRGMTWNCKGGMDKTFATRILRDMGIDVAQSASILHQVEMWGGHCDCEILFNAAERVYDHLPGDNPYALTPEMLAELEAEAQKEDEASGEGQSDRIGDG